MRIRSHTMSVSTVGTPSKQQSGNAEDKCFESLLEYTDTKSAWIRHG